jgi:RimJ/RimL family protein N-acetyltransferase
MTNAFLVGSKVYLRPIEKSDAATIAKWFNDRAVTRTTRQYRPMPVAKEEAFLEQLAKNDGDIIFLMVAKDDDAPVGCCGLNKIDPINRSAELGIIIGEKDRWGQGFGAEATSLLVGYGFETLNLNRVYLHVHEDNERGRRTYRRVGFREEGRLRQDTYREGKYLDSIVMGILRSEWNAG